MKKPFYKTALFKIFAGALFLLCISAIIIPTLGKVCLGPKSADPSCLRQIGQASLIYAMDHKDHLPEATDIWDYARLLAHGAGLAEGTLWQSRLDPATKHTAREQISILLPDETGHPGALNPVFRAIKPSVAVALGKLNTNLPPTTPIAWTRGLQPDGKWAPHSPYGTNGGYIVFIGCNVMFYRNLTDDGGQLIGRNGSKTSNILDALPEGTRIGEYTPTPEEQKQWARASRPGASR